MTIWNVIGIFFAYYGIGISMAMVAWYFNKDEDLTLGDLKPITLLGFVWPIAIWFLVGDVIERHSDKVLIRRRKK
jgi:hypothetical protein